MFSESVVLNEVESGHGMEQSNNDDSKNTRFVVKKCNVV
jgi:hypothetical protein